MTAAPSPSGSAAAEQARARVLFVSQYDPSTPATWSGTPYYMLAALRRVAEVRVLAAPTPRWSKVIGRLGSLLSRETLSLDRHPVVLRHFARRVRAAQRSWPADIIFSPSTIPLSVYDGPEPLAVWTDAVYPQTIGFYPEVPLPTARTHRWNELGETQSLERLRVAAYSSDWAAERGRPLVTHGEVLRIGFGPNLPQEVIDRIRERRRVRTASDEPLRLLWMGVEWVRKGGDIAAEVVAQLNKRGTACLLDVVGSEPTAAGDHVRWHGRLSKSDPAQLARLESLLVEADLLMLPSRADCTPIVVSEAAAIGLPVVVSDVGGLGETVMRHGSGLAVPIGPDEMPALADAVEQVVDDHAGYVARSLEAAKALDYTAGFARIIDAIRAGAS